MFAFVTNRLPAILRLGACCLALPLLLSCCSAQDAVGDRADQLFLRELTERQFFDLAAQHCRRMRSAAATPDRKAKWQLRLCQTCEKQAWFSEAANRGGLLNRSIDEVTEFIQSHSVEPYLNIELRLQQIVTLQNSVRMTLILAEAGHLFARTDQPSGESSSRNAASLSVNCEPAVDRGTELAEELLRHLEEIRSELDPDAARNLRERIRVLLAEFSALKWRVNAESADSQQLLRAAEEALDLASRATRDDELQLRVGWLNGELLLYSGNLEAFELHIRSIADMTASDDFSVPQFLSIRERLFCQEASAAARLASQSSPASALQRQQFIWLGLESLLGVHELVSQLNDEDLLVDARAKFESQREQAERNTRGVFRDAVELTIRRFELIDEVGAEIADLIERIEYLRSRAENEPALRLIDVALRRLPPDSQGRSRGALELRAGEILVEQQKWQAAMDRLGQAVTLYGQAEQINEQAVADLLRIFAMAQRVGATDPADSDLSGPTVSREAYVAALESHLSQFAAQTTWSRAAEWLQRILAEAQPLRAAELAMDRFSREQAPARKIERLTEVAELLDRVTIMEENAAAERLQQGLRSNLTAMLAEPDVYPRSNLARLELTLLRFEMQSPDLNPNRWPEFKTAVDRLHEELTSPAAAAKNSAGSTQEEAMGQLTLLEAVIAARTTNETKRLSEFGDRIAATEPDRIEKTILFLDGQYAGQSLRTGDPWLADLVGRLLRRLLAEDKTAADQRQLVRMLPVAVRSSALLGDSSLPDQLLGRIMQSSLTDQQLSVIAESLAAAESAQTFGTDGAVSASQVRRKFWLSILGAKPQGSAMWLEASLQLATLAASSGDVAKALQQLGVVETLYPQWGDAERRARAAALQEQLKRRAPE